MYQGALAHPNCPKAEIRAAAGKIKQLAKQKKKYSHLQRSLAQNPSLSPTQLARLCFSHNRATATNALANPSTPVTVLRIRARTDPAIYDNREYHVSIAKNPNCPAGVLHYLAKKHLDGRAAGVLMAVCENPNTADKTLQLLAGDAVDPHVADTQGTSSGVSFAAACRLNSVKYRREDRISQWQAAPEVSPLPDDLWLSFEEKIILYASKAAVGWNTAFSLIDDEVQRNRPTSTLAALEELVDIVALLLARAAETFDQVNTALGLTARLEQLVGKSRSGVAAYAEKLLIQHGFSTATASQGTYLSKVASDRNIDIVHPQKPAPAPTTGSRSKLSNVQRKSKGSSSITLT